MAFSIRLLSISRAPSSTNCVTAVQRFSGYVMAKPGDKTSRHIGLLAAEPDLFITDHDHPGLAGGEILRKLADRKVAYPFIFCSACPRGSLKELEAVLELKLVWLQKPFLVEELRTQLSDIFGLGLRFKRNGVDA